MSFLELGNPALYLFSMTFSELNFIGILAAIFFAFVSGGIWFGPKTFYPVWMKARGNASGQLTAEQNKPALLFGGTIIAIIVQMISLGLILSSLQSSRPDFSVASGALVGLVLGVGISMFSSLSHRLFGGENLKVWIIETANDAINYTVAGAIITFFN